MIDGFTGKNCHSVCVCVITVSEGVPPTPRNIQSQDYIGVGYTPTTLHYTTTTNYRLILYYESKTAESKINLTLSNEEVCGDCHV